jgi:hypothetical protein
VFNYCLLHLLHVGGGICGCWLGSPSTSVLERHFVLRLSQGTVLATPHVT